MSLRVTIGDAKPEYNVPRNKVATLDLGDDGAVLLCRLDLNKVSWDLLLISAELHSLTLRQWGLVEPWGDEVSRMYCRLLSKEENTNIIEPTDHL